MAGDDASLIAVFFAETTAKTAALDVIVSRLGEASAYLDRSRSAFPANLECSPVASWRSRMPSNNDRCSNTTKSLVLAWCDVLDKIRTTKRGKRASIISSSSFILRSNTRSRFP